MLKDEWTPEVSKEELEAMMRAQRTTWQMTLVAVLAFALVLAVMVHGCTQPQQPHYVQPAPYVEQYPVVQDRGLDAVDVLMLNAVMQANQPTVVHHYPAPAMPAVRTAPRIAAPPVVQAQPANKVVFAPKAAPSTANRVVFSQPARAPSANVNRVTFTPRPK